MTGGLLRDGKEVFIVYNALVVVFALFYLPFVALKMALRGRARSGIRQRFGIFENGFFGPRGERTVWVHAVSVGETLAAVPIIKELKERRNGIQVYFSTVTETGNSVAREKLDPDDRVFYFPFDLPFVAKSVVSRINPDLFVVVETELWPNVLRSVSGLNIPALLVNGRISNRSYRGYMRFRFFIRRVLGFLDHMNMQGAQDAERVKALGAPSTRVSIAGNVKFDKAFRTAGDLKTSSATKASLGIPEQNIVFIAGSTHPGEEEQVITAYRRIIEKRPDCYLVLAPRHPERVPDVTALVKREGFACWLKSGLKGELPAPPGVVVVDTMGELAGLYRIGDINFVGGSWNETGGHNVLEPVAFGKPVFFGPNMHNFPEISGILKDSGVGIEVKDGAGLAREALRLMGEPERLERLGGVAKETLHANRGALARNVELIERYLYG
jgi:3-deoxy-D-manno-octulosonic-acid transferase